MEEGGGPVPLGEISQRSNGGTDNRLTFDEPDPSRIDGAKGQLLWGVGQAYVVKISA